MSDELQDPGAVPEGGSSMKAKDLKNQVLLLKPTGTGEWPAKDAEYDAEGNVVNEAKNAQPFVVCNVWVLDRSGVVDTGQDVRFSWWKAVEQLKDKVGQFVGCKPVEQDDRSVALVALEGAARDVAAQAIADIKSTEPM